MSPPFLGLLFAFFELKSSFVSKRRYFCPHQPTFFASPGEEDFIQYMMSTINTNNIPVRISRFPLYIVPSKKKKFISPSLSFHQPTQKESINLHLLPLLLIFGDLATNPASVISIKKIVSYLPFFKLSSSLVCKPCHCPRQNL